MTHPKPWRVEYNRRCPEWHPQSCPYIVAANDDLVLELPMTCGHMHPGLYDKLADHTAKEIVRAVNAMEGI